MKCPVSSVCICLLALASPSAVLANWQGDAGDDGWAIYGAIWAKDTQGTHQMTIQCMYDYAILLEDYYSIMIDTDEAYDETASYASQVPLDVLVGDETFTFTGTFVRVGTGLQVLVELAYGTQIAWNSMVTALAQAAQTAAPVTVRYFDTELTFSPKGADVHIEQSLRAYEC